MRGEKLKEPFCTEPGCNRPKFAKGLCCSHYMRDYRKFYGQWKGPVELKRNPDFGKTKHELDEFETINNIPLSVIYKRFKQLDNLVTL